MHLEREGFSNVAIKQMIDWGVRSLTSPEAKSLNISYQGHSPEGLWFPFNREFGQLRCDNFTPKYLSPRGAKTAAWNRGGQVVTEGFKDAAAGCLMGQISTGAIAGVTHYRSLPQLGQTVIFDSDAPTNPNVFAALVRAATFLKGKALFVPRKFGQKAGLCEFFRLFDSPKDQAAAYQELLQTAMTPLEMLYHLPCEWRGLTLPEIAACAKKLTTLAYDFSEIIGDRRSIDSFCTHVSSVSGYSRKLLLGRFAQETSLSINSPSFDRRPNRIDTGWTIPIEICLSRSNREVLDGVNANKNCTAFNLAADLYGVSTILDRLGQRYSDPLTLFRRFGSLSNIPERELDSVWRSAVRRRSRAVLPQEKILRNISFWQHDRQKYRSKSG